MHGLAVAGAIWLGSGAIPAGESVVELVFETPASAPAVRPPSQQPAVSETAPADTEETPSPTVAEPPPPPATTPVALQVPAVPPQPPRRDTRVRPAKAPSLPKAADNTPAPSKLGEQSAPETPTVAADGGPAEVDAPTVAAVSEPAVAPPANDIIPLLSSEPRFRRPPTPPDYPRRAIDLGQEGEVRVRVRVDAEGASREILVWRSSGVPLLDEAALRAVRKWLFETANVGGRPVESWVEVPVRFRLSRS